MTMIGIITNEVDIVYNILNNNICTVKENEAINMLLKYCFSKGYDDKYYIREYIIDIMEKCDRCFSRSSWYDTIDKRIDKMKKNKRMFSTEYKLNNIKSIPITKNEFKIIKDLKNKKLMKLYFVMLVYCKINKIINKIDGNWINQKYSTLFKEARLSGKKESNLLLLRQLMQLGYITPNNRIDKTSIKLNYVYDDEIEFEVKTFDYIIYDLLHHINNKVRRCEVCGKIIYQKSKKPPKYCNKCAKEKERINIKNRVKKFRNK